jgi:DNA-binding transcriptional LysR family regulator
MSDSWTISVDATFLQRYPHSRLDIRLVDNMVDPIKDGFDVAFGAGPLQDSTLIAQKCSAVHSSSAPHPTSPGNWRNRLSIPSS